MEGSSHSPGLPKGTSPPTDLGSTQDPLPPTTPLPSLTTTCSLIWTISSPGRICSRESMGTWWGMGFRGCTLMGLEAGLAGRLEGHGGGRPRRV